MGNINEKITDPHISVKSGGDNWGGVTSSTRKTVTTIVDNCGGVTSYACKAVTTIVDNCGGITSFMC